jgi:hypothetical protein
MARQVLRSRRPSSGRSSPGLGSDYIGAHAIEVVELSRYDAKMLGLTVGVRRWDPAWTTAAPEVCTSSGILWRRQNYRCLGRPGEVARKHLRQPKDPSTLACPAR